MKRIVPNTTNIGVIAAAAFFALLGFAHASINSVAFTQAAVTAFTATPIPGVPLPPPPPQPEHVGTCLACH